MRAVQRTAFLLLAAAMLIAAALLPSSRKPPQDTETEKTAVYVYRGYGAATDAPWDGKSRDFAVHRFRHLLEKYFPEGHSVYLAVVPDKAEFTVPPEGYVPAGAQETSAYLTERLDAEAVDIAPRRTLEDYYRTVPHWRQEQLRPVAETLLRAMGAAAPETADETLCALEGEFRGSYWGKTEESLQPDVLSYLTSPGLEGCTVYNYETDSTGGVYDYAAAQDAPYDLFLSGSRSLLRIENPAVDRERVLVVFRDSFGSSLIPLLAEGYGTVYAVDIRYIASDALQRVVSFPQGADVLFLYSTTVLHNSITLK